MPDGRAQGRPAVAGPGWLLGGDPRRLVIAAVLLGPQPVGGWTPGALVGLVDRKVAAQHLERLRGIGLLSEGASGGLRVVRQHPLFEPVCGLLRALDS